jgi:hypothetical protein
MTAQHLHEKLGISFQELGALLGVRNMLAAGLLIPNADDYPDGSHVFSMHHPGMVYGCGSVGCIAGSMAILMGHKQPMTYTNQFDQDSLRGKDKIAALFYPRAPNAAMWSDITPKMAVRAIDNFLNYGDPKWGTVRK